MAQNDITPNLGINLEATEVTLTATVSTNVTAAINNVVTAQIQGATATVGGTITAETKGTLTAAINNVVTAESRGQVTAVGTVTAEAKGTITAQVQGLTGTVNISGISAVLGTGAWNNNTGLLTYWGLNKTLLTTASAVSASGNNIIVPAVGSKRIKVYAYSLAASGAGGVNAKLTDLVNDYSPDLPLTANTPFTPGSVNPPAYLFGTLSGSALNMRLQGNIAVAYAIHYFTDDGT